MKINDNIYPKVLVISSAAMNNHSATGVTMSSLFKGWPSDRIAQIYDDSTEPNRAICENCYRLSVDDFWLLQGIKKTVQTLRSGIRLFRPGSSQSTTLAASLNSSLVHSSTSAWGDLVPFTLSKELRTWLDEFKPDVIYSVFGSIRMMELSRKIASRHAIKIVPHFMDDWPATIYQHSCAHWLPSKVLNRSLKKTLSSSRDCMAISEDMAREFEQRYMLSFSNFMNCIEMEKDKKVVCNAKDGIVLFGYVGGLHLNRWKSLKAIGLAMQGLNASGVTPQLVIHAPQKDIDRYKVELESVSSILIGGSLPYESISKEILKYDVLVHIESFLATDQKYTRLSISTKIPQYMSSGLPILAYGPTDISSINYIKNTESGLIVDLENNDKLLIDSIHSLSTSPGLREKLGSNGYLRAKEFHNALIERERFRAELTKYL